MAHSLDVAFSKHAAHEAKLYSKLKSFMHIIGYNLDIITEEPLSYDLPYIVVGTSVKGLSEMYCELQLSFKTLENFAYSIPEEFSLDLQARICNYIGLFDELERVLEIGGVKLKPLDDVTMSDDVNMSSVSTDIVDSHELSVSETYVNNGSQPLQTNGLNDWLLAPPAFSNNLMCLTGIQCSSPDNSLCDWLTHSDSNLIDVFKCLSPNGASCGIDNVLNEWLLPASFASVVPKCLSQSGTSLVEVKSTVISALPLPNANLQSCSSDLNVWLMPSSSEVNASTASSALNAWPLPPSPVANTASAASSAISVWLLPSIHKANAFTDSSALNAWLLPPSPAANTASAASSALSDWLFPSSAKPLLFRI